MFGIILQHQFLLFVLIILLAVILVVWVYSFIWFCSPQILANKIMVVSWLDLFPIVIACMCKALPDENAIDLYIILINRETFAVKMVNYSKSHRFLRTLYNAFQKFKSGIVIIF